MSESELRRELLRIDGRPYGHYRDLRGRDFRVRDLELSFAHVQGDPFASPSRLRVGVPPALARLPDFAHAAETPRRAAADFLHRALCDALGSASRREGSGSSGRVEIAPLGPQVLERTAVDLLAAGEARLRLCVGLPASGRRIRGSAASRVLTERLPDALHAVFERLDAAGLERHVRSVEDQIALREALPAAGLVGFVADGSLLPRRSGAETRPLEGGIPFEAPASLAVELEAPHAGRLRGLGIPRGVTLIVGGGYHGKSTLLQALALGVYDHCPGDGRERVVSSADAVSIRAEDGRAVCGVDLRPFIRALPLGRSTERFSTADASGSTSQAAAILEALELGADLLLIDEDTAATNFMLRDERMRRLVPSEQEPITPFLDRVRALYEERGVSSVLVVGGAGDYLDVADTVIQMDAYRAHDVTERARAVTRSLPRRSEDAKPPDPMPPARPRVPEPSSLDPSRGRRAARVRSVKTRAIEFGREEIDVSALYQLVDPAQGRLIGDALLQLAREICDGRRPIAELLAELERRVAERGLETVAESGFGDRAAARRYEVGAALNRLRSLRLR